MKTITKIILFIVVSVLIIALADASDPEIRFHKYEVLKKYPHISGDDIVFSYKMVDENRNYHTLENSYLDYENGSIVYKACTYSIFGNKLRCKYLPPR